MLTLANFDYHLPPARIAQTPVSPRDSCKLLVVDRQTGKLRDQIFSDLEDLLTPGDVLVLNDTKVFPARLYVEKRGKDVELLLEKEIALTPSSITFSALTKPGLKGGEVITIPHTRIQAVCIGVEGYTRLLQFNVGREKFFGVLNRWAQTPIPPYIKWHKEDEADLRRQYQTVFARKKGAMAAPTAGLHFTQALLTKLKNAGVQLEYVTLHVGLGTFLPVKTENLKEHHMHEEWYELNRQTAARLNAAKTKGKRIIAVGTTTVRVLETCTASVAFRPQLAPRYGLTGIFIYPPYKFKFVDSLITNFHTPKSTLLMLVAALTSRPNATASFTSFSDSLMGNAYQYALEHDYRFYSFGDAMWIR